MNSHAAVKIAIVGRPNVGKSTLFNRLLRRRKALVFAEPGITRDRHYGELHLGGHPFVLIDTGGLSESASEEMTSGITEQAQEAINEADLLVVLFDGADGPCVGDEYLVDLLRRLDKPKIFVVNKLDTEKKLENLYGFYQLGIDDLLPLSAEHKRGLRELEHKILEVVDAKGLAPPVQKKENAPTPTETAAIRIAVIGRPNVGKSSLMNLLLRQNRSLVTEIPGTTRDAVFSYLKEDNTTFCFIDTAGVRRKGKTQGVEGLSVIKTIRAIEEAHIVVLVLDLKEGVTEQDCKVAGLAHRRGRGVLIFGNKLDLLPAKINRRDLIQNTYGRLSFLQYAPLMMGSALKSQFSRKEFFTWVKRIESYRRLQIPTAELNDFIKEKLQDRPLPMRKGKRLKVYYMTQALAHAAKAQRLRPATPSFVVFMNEPDAIHYSDKRFLVNVLRERYEFTGNPIHLDFRKRGRQHQSAK